MTNRVQNADRKVFLDILRVAATCAVVLLHTVSGVKDTTDMTLYPGAFKGFWAILDLITWCVPVFVMISGYLFLNPRREFTWKQMLFKYCRRIALALVLFGVPYAIMELVAIERVLNASTLKRACLMVLHGKSWSHMWYLYMVFLLYLVTPVLRWGLKRLPRVAVYFVLVILLLGSSLFPYINKCYQAEVLPTLSDDGIYFFYYLSGYLFAVNDADGKKRIRIPGWLCLGLIGIISAGMVLSRWKELTHVYMAYEYPYTVLMSLLLFAWTAGLERNWRDSLPVLFGNTARYHWMLAGDLCFAIYLIHPLFINISYKFLGMTPLAYPLEISLPLFWGVILLLSILAAWILCKIPLLKKYVL